MKINILPDIKKSVTQLRIIKKTENIPSNPPVKSIEPGEYPIIDKFFEKLIYYSHKAIYKIAYLDSKKVQTTKIPLKGREKNSQAIMADLIEKQNNRCETLYSFKIMRKGKILGENYIGLESPRTTEYIDGTNIGITFPPHFHVYFSDTLMGRKKYKNLFNILNQAVLEKGISTQYIPKITFAPVKMGNNQRSIGMDSYQKFIGANNGTFSRDTIIANIINMVNKNNFLFEETPQNILQLFKNEKLNLPDIENKLIQILEKKKT